MTSKSLKRFDTIQRLLRKEILVKDAAELLNTSTRQVIRLKNDVTAIGAAALVHGNFGKVSSHKISDDIKQKIVSLKQTPIYQSANFAHFTEIVAEELAIVCSYTSIRNILIESGITSPKKQRTRKQHNRRKRKPASGMLIQIDASKHDWFGCPAVMLVCMVLSMTLPVQ